MTIDNIRYMRYGNYMITDADIQKMKKVFATKDDLKPIKKSLGTMNKKLDLTISYFDKATASHEPRIKAIETQLGIIQPKN